MTKPQTQIPFRQRAIFTRPVFDLKTVGWSMLGTLSALYLAVVTLAPDWLEGLLPVTNLNPQSNQGQRATARLSTEIGNLRDSVSRIQLDLARVKTDSEGFAERQNALTVQVTGLEQKLSTLAQQKIDAGASVKLESATGDRAAVEILAPAAPGAGDAAVAPAAPAASIQGNAAQPKLINADPAVATGTVPAGTAAPRAQITTASTDAIDFGPAVVKATPKPMGIKISSGASVDALRLSWTLLAERHSDTLKNLRPRYTSSGDAQNPNFDLIAGPLKSSADAKRLCKALAAKNVPCQVGAFGGETL